MIPPGSTIGILGGGQLGRMTAMAARTLGYHVHVLDPDANCAASAVADRVVAAKFDDADAASDLARQCDVVTLEIEQIGPDALDAAMRHAPVRPSPAILAMVQDRSRQKRWLATNGFPVGDYRDVASLEQLASAQRDLGALVVKANRGGYDGRSQVRVADAAAVERAWADLGHRASVAERALDLAIGDLRPRRATAERRGSRLSAGAQLSRATDPRLVRTSRSNRRRARGAGRRDRARHRRLRSRSKASSPSRCSCSTTTSCS